MKHQDRKGGTLTMESVYKRRTKESSICMALLLFLLIPCTAKAGTPNATAPDSSRLQKEEQLCRELEDKIKNKQDTRKFVKASIQLGYNACGVIKCAVKSGGDLKQIFEGALEAGITKDVVSKCALDVCAETKDRRACANEIASNINSIDPEMCYLLLEEPEYIIPPGHDPSKRRIILSPSGF